MIEFVLVLIDIVMENTVTVMALKPKLVVRPDTLTMSFFISAPDSLLVSSMDGLDNADLGRGHVTTKAIFPIYSLILAG